MKSALKTILKIVASFVVICFIFVCISAAYFTSWKDAKINNLNIYFSKLANSATAGSFEWDGDTDNMTFTVPDEYEGVKVKNLGGVVGMAPTEFFIAVPASMHPDSVICAESEECAGEIDENTVIYDFTVKLGKNIRNFEYFTYKEYHMDKKDNVIYIVNIKYKVSADNKWVYSKDGRLYDKKTEELIGDI